MFKAVANGLKCNPKRLGFDGLVNASRKSQPAVNVQLKLLPMTWNVFV